MLRYTDIIESSYFTDQYSIYKCLHLIATIFYLEEFYAMFLLTLSKRLH